MIEWKAFGYAVMRVMDSTIERSLPVFAEGSQPDVLFRLCSFVIPVIASSSLCAEFIFDTLNKTLVTPSAILYRRAHGDARRGLRSGSDVGAGPQVYDRPCVHGEGQAAQGRAGVEAGLEACAENGGKPPDDLSPWLPWTMSEERRRELTAPG